MTPYYQQDGVTIYHGDCREIVPSLPVAELLISDPPYGMNERTMRASAGRGKTPDSRNFRYVQSRDWPAVHGDNEPFDPSPWLGYRKVVLFGGIHFADRLPPSRAWIVWDKRDGTASDDNADCDFAWTNLRGPARLYSQLWRGICRSGEENVSTSGGLVHPTQKPVALMRWVIARCKPAAGDVILDPFMGSGTTLVAAKRSGVRSIGIEINEHYCEIAVKRLQQGALPLELGA